LLQDSSLSLKRLAAKVASRFHFLSLKFWQKGKAFNSENAEEHKEDLQVSRAYTVTAIVANFECSQLSPANCNLPPETRQLAKSHLALLISLALQPDLL